MVFVVRWYLSLHIFAGKNPWENLALFFIKENHFVFQDKHFSINNDVLEFLEILNDEILVYLMSVKLSLLLKPVVYILVNKNVALIIKNGKSKIFELHET